MLKYIFLNLLITQTLGKSITPGLTEWTYIPKINRSIQRLNFIDNCGSQYTNMLSPNQKYLFFATTPSNNFSDQNIFIHTLSTNNGTELWNISINTSQIDLLIQKNIFAQIINASYLIITMESH